MKNDLIQSTEEISVLSIEEWDNFFKNNNVMVPYLDVCVFAIKKLRALPPWSVIYEFGCGMGNNLKFIRREFNSVRILGSDASSVAIDLLKSARLSNAEFWVNDKFLNIKANNIDLVIERGALQHVEKKQAINYVNEIYESMKYGGEGFFEIASTAHGLYKKLGKEGYDPSYGYRTFYSLDEIKTLFSRFHIKNIYHLKREIVVDQGVSDELVQGSFQVEIKK